MVKSVTTKLVNSSDKVDRYLDNIHKIINETKDIDGDILTNLVNDIDGWRDCLVEIELGIRKLNQINHHNDNYEYDDEQKEIIIY